MASPPLSVTQTIYPSLCQLRASKSMVLNLYKSAGPLPYSQNHWLNPNLLLNDGTSLQYIPQILNTKIEIAYQNEMNQQINKTFHQQINKTFHQQINKTFHSQSSESMRGRLPPMPNYFGSERLSIFFKSHLDFYQNQVFSKKN